MQRQKSVMTTAALAAFLGVWAIGGVSPAEAQLKYTGCLKNNGKIVRVAPGDSPSKPCKKKQTEVMFPGTDKTDALMEKDMLLMSDVTNLQAKDTELMDKDTALMDDVTALEVKDADLQGQIDAMQEQIVALSAKNELLMQCLNTDRYLDLGLTVFDCQTWLEWEKKTAGNVDDTFTWSMCNGPVGPDQCPPDGTAFDYIAQLNTGPCFAGHCDWQLPEVNRDGGAEELETIVDLSQGFCGGGSGPCIDSIFGPTAFRGDYWSSVASADLPDSAWGVSFIFGDVTLLIKRSVIHVRAVRTGP